MTKQFRVALFLHCDHKKGQVKHYSTHVCSKIGLGASLLHLHHIYRYYNCLLCCVNLLAVYLFIRYFYACYKRKFCPFYFFIIKKFKDAKIIFYKKPKFYPTRVAGQAGVFMHTPIALMGVVGAGSLSSKIGRFVKNLIKKVEVSKIV